MAASLSASEAGLKIFEQARNLKGWNKTASGKNSPWPLEINKSTLERFHKRQPIKHENFVAICDAMGIEWQEIVDLSESTASKAIVSSNLQVDRSASTELDIFSQQIFDWFVALDFTAEGLPKRDGNYVEWIIHLPMQWAGHDRVLVRTIIHETVLGDLDDFKKAVAQYKADQGLSITSWRVSQAVHQALIESDRKLTCLTFDQLIDRSADFSSYFGWLEKEIKEIEKFYVPLYCKKGELNPITNTMRNPSIYARAEGGIDRYINQWLANPVAKHVSILGEFGTGKTWFTLHYAWKCLQAYQIAKEEGLPRPRLPLVIRLRNYAKSPDVTNVMAGFFFSEHNIKMNHAVFDRLNQMGKLLLIFDGFDEMADRNTPQKVADHFWELAKVVTPNAKVILTCRTEHFPKGEDERNNFEGKCLPSNTNKIAVAPKFETLELMKFDDEQIREVLSRRTKAAATVELVMANSQLLDLLRRAVLAEFVLEALPEIEAGKKIDLARVYLYAVRHKMERDITTGRTFTSLADKLYFLCELAWKMLSEDRMTLNYREFPDRLKLLFGKEVESKKHLDHWHYDMMGQTMLIRNDDGDYSPAHRSLLEFFVAYKFAAELGLLADDFLEMAQNQSGIDESLTPEFYTWSSYWRREVNYKGERELIAPLAGFKPEPLEKLRGTFGRSPLTKAILELLVPALTLEIKYREPNLLLDLIRQTKLTDAEYSGGNAATILVELDSNALEYQDLSGTNLAYANFVNAELKGTNLNGANLENCLTKRVFGTLNDIIMSKDNRQFITAHSDNTIRIWDRASGRELKWLLGHQNTVKVLALSGDGQRLYSGGHVVKEWDPTDGTCQRTFEVDSENVCVVDAIALSGDGKFLYAGGKEAIEEWDLVDGSCRRTFESHKGFVSEIVISRDGQFLYSGSGDGTIKEWDLTDGSCRRTFESDQSFVFGIVMSGDGQFLYSSGGEGTIKEWDLTDGICRRTFESYQTTKSGIALSGNGQFLYSGGDRAIEEWDLVDGSCRRTFESHQSSVKIALSGDGQFLYSGSGDGTLIGSGNGIIKEWNLFDGCCWRTFKSHQSSVNAIAISGDGRSLYAGSDDGIIKEWDLFDGSCQRTFEGHQGCVDAIALSRDGQFLYAGGSYGSIFGGGVTIKEWDLTDGSCWLIFENYQSFVRGLVISGDGRSLYASRNSGTIEEWDLTDGSCRLTFESDQSFVDEIAISGDGRFLYASSSNGALFSGVIIKEWDLADGSCRRILADYQGLVHTISLSADGQFL
ncbi:NACHT domain-containing protein, partial [Chamaesiphon sp. VAR_48_metabat_403]|uniref:NACHT domain-containing protein n=1 Tax=Chamaesiphon sp. VAR_48_metabat_403 TaxID=2964700 RepID=UPI00286D9F71